MFPIEIARNKADKGGKKITFIDGDMRELRVGKFDAVITIFNAVSTNRTDYVATNDPSQHCSNDTQNVCAMRWDIEQFHREIKQITGVEKCEYRKQRIQRNHIACALLVWVKMKQIAYKTKESVYQIKKGLLHNYLIQELKSPLI